MKIKLQDVLDKAYVGKLVKYYSNSDELFKIIEVSLGLTIIDSNVCVSLKLCFEEDDLDPIGIDYPDGIYDDFLEFYHPDDLAIKEGRTRLNYVNRDKEEY